MKTLNLNEMESLKGSCSMCWGGDFSYSDFGCGAMGLAAGMASGFNPLIGGLTTLGCMLTQ